MSWVTTVLAFLKVVQFFINLYLERDKKKAEEKAIVGKVIVDAFKEADPKTRASRLSAAVVDINILNQLHK